jgi:hypothetical protein
VMLRHLDIPARMAAGFSQGRWDDAQQAYVVTERDAHTWVEVYFPGYGWVEFEPTAAQAPLNRQGDENFSQQPVGQQAPTATPQATPTPPPTSTPEPTSTPPDQDENAGANSIPPSPTPTFTPTPTATPVIVPTQPPPMPRQPQSSFDFILPALGLGLLGIFLLLIIVGIGLFIYWWWEWRGLRGMSPVSRAYARLERYIPLVGVRLHDQQTPEERRRQIVKGVPRAERPVTAITRLYTAERYGPGMRHPAEAQQNRQVAEGAWLNARKKILRRWTERFMFWKRE